MSLKTTINSNGCSINLALLLAALAKAELHWEMSRAQLFALDLMAGASGSITITSEVSAEMPKEFISPCPVHTLLGIDVKVNNDYPETLIRLMWGDREISRIEALAVPAAMSRGMDWDTHQASEKAKFQKLTY